MPLPVRDLLGAALIVEAFAPLRRDRRFASPRLPNVVVEADFGAPIFFSHLDLPIYERLRSIRLNFS